MKEIILREYEVIIQPAETVLHEPIIGQDGKVLEAGWTEILRHAVTERREITKIPEGWRLVRNLDENNAEIECVVGTHNKHYRTYWLDIYRRYQAAVAYGEYRQVDSVETFIQALQNNDYEVLHDIPPQLKYFAGECTFQDSGLVRREKIIL